MKKIFMSVVMALCTLAANAQNFTLWYDASIASISPKRDHPNSEFKQLDIGLAYTIPISTRSTGMQMSVTPFKVPKSDCPATSKTAKVSQNEIFVRVGYKF